MPNTKSAERRMRNSSRKQAQNRSVKSRLHTLEGKFTDLAASGKKTEAIDVLKSLVSAFDKAAKSGVVHRRRAARKKSRLALQLNRIGKSA